MFGSAPYPLGPSDPLSEQRTMMAARAGMSRVVIRETAASMGFMVITNITGVNARPSVGMSTISDSQPFLSLNGRVANTCNLSEDWVGYSTRYGDAAGDFAPHR